MHHDLAAGDSGTDRVQVAKVGVMEAVRRIGRCRNIDYSQVVVGQCLYNVTTKPAQPAGDCNLHPILPTREGFMHAAAVRRKSQTCRSLRQTALETSKKPY